MKRSLKDRFAFWLHGRALQMSPMVSMAWTQFIENRAQERAQQLLDQAERQRTQELEQLIEQLIERSRISAMN